MTDPTEIKKPTKILIMGLDNSGKTSILMSLRENTNLLSYFSLRPTKGLSVEEFNGDTQGMVCWDLGGQVQYRNKYMKDFSRYAKETEKIIFVIDIQDTNRYNIALEYLEELIHVLKDSKNFIEISLFLHKFDPNLIKRDDFKELYQKINTELVNKIREIIPNNFNYDIFKTTIYTVFEKSLF
ncbi:MAG: ADP-ribosylation factor-like protein [Promethearchaeota archaeon]